MGTVVVAVFVDDGDGALIVGRGEDAEDAGVVEPRFLAGVDSVDLCSDVGGERGDLFHIGIEIYGGIGGSLEIRAR